MGREQVALRLDLIVAKAKQLAMDVRSHRLWDGELHAGLQEIKTQLDNAMQESRIDL